MNTSRTTVHRGLMRNDSARKRGSGHHQDMLFETTRIVRYFTFVEKGSARLGMRASFAPLLIEFHKSYSSKDSGIINSP